MTRRKAAPIVSAMSETQALRRGWTTGACATAAAKAAFQALLTGTFPDPVEIALPGGKRAAFALAEADLLPNGARVGVIKDAGDDPDVTHGALIRVRVTPAATGMGVVFRAGPGVGMVTRPGLAIPPGEPAINPVPRQMIREALAEVAHGSAADEGEPDIEVEISVVDGERLAERTLNGRLGIVGGLSILGTTGVVIPYSCAAWIHSIHRGIDVARAIGLTHVAGATGKTSEAAAVALHGLPDTALIDMGDFVGGMLKYLRTHPLPRVTIAGGVAKMTKLAQGRLDLHSKRGVVDLEALAQVAQDVGGPPALAEAITHANTAAQAFQMAASDGLALGDAIAEHAWRTAARVLRGADTELEILLFDREGALVGRAGFAPVHV
jgi:cobalt-precorrin-5B (C1)-methyltransferase